MQKLHRRIRADAQASALVLLAAGEQAGAVQGRARAAALHDGVESVLDRRAARRQVALHCERYRVSPLSRPQCIYTLSRVSCINMWLRLERWALNEAAAVK